MAKSIKYLIFRAYLDIRWQLALTRFAFRQARIQNSSIRPQGFVPSRRGAILIVERVIPAPDKNAGDRNIIEFIQTLVADSRHVIFWPLSDLAEPSYVDALVRCGAQVIMGPDRPSIRRWLHLYEDMLDQVLVCRPEVAARWLPQSTAGALGKTAYYGHDLHFARMEKQAELSDDCYIRAEAMHMKSVEMAIWQKVPRSLYPTLEEVDLIRTLEPTVDVRHVQIFCFDTFSTPTIRPSGKAIVFVAGFGHAPNIDAAIWLAQKIFPLVLEKHPDADLSLIGSNPTAEVLALASERVRVTGWVSADALTVFYSTAGAAIIPLRFGAGLKLKVVEALANAVPLATTTIGAQGLDGLEKVAAVAESERALADALARILSLSDDEWLNQAQRQAGYAAARFSRAGMRNSLLQALGGLGPAVESDTIPTRETSDATPPIATRSLV